jgi:23S rRNA (uridine2479-2'-O)-methyltransferase
MSGRVDTTIKLASATNAYQRVEALGRNRTLRHRHREIFVEGVRPINLAARHGWRFKSIWYEDGRRLSTWAVETINDLRDATAYAVTPELMARLSQRDEPSELIAVVELRPSGLAGIGRRDDLLVAVADRPGNPGNLGTMIRSCDALGAHGLLISGHAADPFDPQTIRASMGSIFALPVVQVSGPAQIKEYVASVRGLQVVGTDSGASQTVDEIDLRGPTLLIVGNEAEGLSYAYRQLCDHIARIPLAGAADSLNLAVATSIALYEIARQRRVRNVAKSEPPGEPSDRARSSRSSLGS